MIEFSRIEFESGRLFGGYREGVKLKPLRPVGRGVPSATEPRVEVLNIFGIGCGDKVERLVEFDEPQMVVAPLEIGMADVVKFAVDLFDVGLIGLLPEYSTGADQQDAGDQAGQERDLGAERIHASAFIR